MATNATRELAALRRRLRNVAPEVSKATDRELRNVGRDVARRAAGNSVTRSGQFRRGWKVSLTASRGVAVRNIVPYARQQEYGAKIWIRRGLPYQSSGGTGPSTAMGRRGPVPMRQRPAGGGKVVNEAQILIPRDAPGRRAVDQELPRSRERIGAVARAATVRALS